MTAVTAVVSEEALQGNLRDFPLPALMRSLASGGRTGTLTVDGGSEIWFSNGRVYLATTDGGSPISAVLYGADVGSLAEIEGLFAMPETEATVLDQVLARSPETEPLIRRLLHEYNLNSLFELLVPTEAAFTFEAGRHHRLGDRLAGDTGTLLAQAEHRVEIWRRIASRIPTTSASFRLSANLPDSHFERLVSADEWRYLAQLDGTNTVADVITNTGESAFRVCSTLYRLLLERLIEEVV
ncbi:MAG: DUF4388 domain-containing protein [Acidimicrobiales bacterium]